MFHSLEKRSFPVKNNQQRILLIIPPIFLAISATVVAVRWRTRQMKRVNTLVEDILCLLSLILMVLVVLGVVFLVVLHGQGQPTDIVMAHFGPKVGIQGWLQTQFAIDILWASAVLAVQLSLLQFYTHLYDSRGLYQLVKMVMMGLILVWYLYTVSVSAYFCHPPGSCRQVEKRNCVAIGSLHVFFNAMVMLAPIPAVWDLEASPRKKLSTIGLFLLGSFCTICAILRMDCVFPFFADITLDPIGASWGRTLFSPLEIAVAIIACSIPTLTTYRIAVWRDDRSTHSRPTMLSRLRFVSGSSEGSSTTNLNTHPANWVGKNAGQVNTFISLEEGRNSRERTQPLGPHDIQVTKEYNVLKPAV